MTQLISNQCTIDSRPIPSIQQKNKLLGSCEMLIFTHKFLNILVLLILKCFCHTCTCRQSYKCNHTPRCALPYLHTPSVSVLSFGKPVYLPMPHWSPRQWESTPWVQVHTTPVWVSVCCTPSWYSGAWGQHFTSTEGLRCQWGAASAATSNAGSLPTVKKYSCFFYESFLSSVSVLPWLQFSLIDSHHL